LSEISKISLVEEHPSRMMIALCFKLDGTSVGIRFGIVGVPFDHQRRDAPDVDLSYHAGNLTLACVSN
jgi:hypothetical protein